MEKLYYNVLVVGAGGTGTYFLKEISRYISSEPNVKNVISSLVIADGDSVEEKNLSRQCFYPEDIGRKKASVMAEILSDAYELNWRSYPYYLTNMDDISHTVGMTVNEDSNKIPVIIGCVDNHAARLVCEKYFSQSRNCIYFDSANEFDTGEAVFAYKINGKVVGPCRSYYFPEMTSGDLRLVTEISCEELNQATPQHIFTNMMAGLQLCSAFAGLMNGNVTPGVSFFNSLTFSNEFFPFEKEIHGGKCHE